jgi:hypothetical protein
LRFGPMQFPFSLHFGLAAFAHDSPLNFDGYCHPQASPMRASEEELPQLAKGHQGNSNRISKKLRIRSVGLANWNTQRLVLAPAPTYDLFRPGWAVSRREAEVGQNSRPRE